MRKDRKHSLEVNPVLQELRGALHREPRPTQIAGDKHIPDLGELIRQHSRADHIQHVVEVKIAAHAFQLFIRQKKAQAVHETP